MASDSSVGEMEQDVDSLRLKHESDNEWLLRRKFIKAHIGKFPLERLLCLSSCFVNITMMGCSYPPRVMEQMNNLSEDLQDDVKKFKDKKLQHIMKVQFVKSQSSDEQTGSSFKRKAESDEAPISKRPGVTQKQTPKTMTFVKAGDQYKSTDLKSEAGVTSPKPANPVTMVTHRDAVNSKVNEAVLNKFYKLKQKIREILPSAQNSVEAIKIAADKLHMSVTTSVQPFKSQQFVWEQMIDSVIVGRGCAPNKRNAKLKASEDTINRLGCSYLKIDKVDSQPELTGTDTPPLSSNSFASNQGRRVIESNASTVFQGKKRPYQNVPIEKFLIIEQKYFVNSNPLIVLRQSADFNKALLQYEFVNNEAGVVCSIYINEEHIADGTELSKTMAKSTASANALDVLKRICWTIKVKQLADSDETAVTKDELHVGTGESNSGGASITEAIPDSNIGNKLLKMMGWSGGGLGKSQQGIAEPVSMDSVINREGLGLKTEQGIGKQFVSVVRDIINNYIRSGQQNDLVFSPEFMKEERAIIHTQAQKLGLRSHSHGSGSERFLILSRKRSAGQLFDHIMQSGGSTSKYELHPPVSA